MITASISCIPCSCDDGCTTRGTCCCTKQVDGGTITSIGSCWRRERRSSCALNRCIATSLANGWSRVINDCYSLSDSATDVTAGVDSLPRHCFRMLTCAPPGGSDITYELNSSPTTCV